MNGISTHSLGKPAAQFPGAVTTDAFLKIAVDRLQTTLASPLDGVTTSMTVASSAGIVAYTLLSIDDEIVSVTAPPVGNVVSITRGFDGTTPALHLAGALVSGFIDAWHHNAMVAEIEAIETALGANLVNIPGFAILMSSAFIFPAQAPGGSLIAGANSITLSPVPAGVNGTDVGHYLYISGGTGTAEPALITGGSAVAGAPSGTLIIQCVNTHSGAWTIQSASGGIAEALITASTRNPGGGCVYVPGGLWTIYGPITMPSSCTLFGCRASHLLMGANCVGFFGSKAMLGNNSASYHDITIAGLEIDGNTANNTAVPPGPRSLISFDGTTSTRVKVRDCYIHGFPGNGTNGGAAAAWTASQGGRGNEFTNNVLYAESAACGGGVLTTATTLISGNHLLPTGTGVAWADAGITLNGAYCFDSIMVNNIVYAATVNLEAGAYQNIITGNVIDCGGFAIAGGPAAIPVWNAGENNVISNNCILNVGSGANAIQLLQTAPNRITISGNFFTMLSGAANKVAAPNPPGNWLIDEFGLVGGQSVGVSNGANQNISIQAATGTGVNSTAKRLVNVAGPTAAFSIGGIVATPDGCEVTLNNAAAGSAQMTINYNDSGSAAANRINTPTRANVNCVVARLVYSGGVWTLVSYA